ncbi:MAG: hypothetical protein R3D81_14945 [Thalassovita sp.]
MSGPMPAKPQNRPHEFAGVLTLWDDLDAPQVTPQAMGWGVTLAQYYLTEARRLAEAGLVSEETAKAERLRHWLLESWGYDDVTPREILRMGPNSLREAKEAKKAIATLERHGWLVPLPEGATVRGAQRKEAYRIVRPTHAV